MTGYFPIGFSHFVPDRVLASAGASIVILERNRSESECSDEAKKSAVPAEAVLSEGEWVVVSDGSLQAMSLDEIGRWRDQKACELVQRAMEMKGDPLKVLKMLESAAFLRNLNLGEFVSALRTQREGEGESLESVFLRVRGSRAGGRTGG